ncbi:MAG TPA: TIGR03560 family F420-dependent LLM class oxidoreductase [Actinophytocola sp.]|uniref:TIGR03560 family F420-dependent LLM class oxidoreductase n=1 Tax=Actinophytocola sp. TaxID=1872138 RepID=UPI002DC04D4B|nr:TIGR03560 family F420-dependent LLM class oxidoreductase [Actinophytocola sp.]HEU5471648.1 TIGR03560 family F420-dependent LLM class oxidoreductase [Actinophytocola sp.]
MALNLPSPCVVVLVGPGAAGKSSWAAEHFPADAVVSSDRLRALAGSGEDDITASTDAFGLLDQIVAMRVGRGLTTVIDTLGLDTPRRRGWLELARQHGLPAVAVAFDTPAGECRARNRGRAKRIPAEALTAQLRGWREVKGLLAGEGWDHVLEPQPVRVVPAAFVAAQPAAGRQRERPTGLRFGLHLSTFTFDGGTAATADRLREIADAAEQTGFDAIYVMDHFRQIPQVGRAWDNFLESYTTLAYLAACTRRARLGALVTGITYRNVGHLGKIIATLDVLSGGRAVCGLGLAWFKAEHTAYGWAFPPVRDRYALLEDALRLLPLLWGPGGPAFDGAAVSVPEAACYPRPLQEHLPVIVGGGGERRTLRLAARYADAANVLGDLDVVRHKATVLRRHCADIGRDPDSVALTHLGTALVGSDDAELTALVERLRPQRMDPARFRAAVNAGTVADHVGRFRELAEAGVAEVMVRLPDLTGAESLARIGKVIAAFR